MSAISFCTASKEEWIEGHSPHWKALPEAEQKKYLAMLEQYVTNYDLHINWEKWVKWKENLPKGHFLFAKHTSEVDKLFFVSILNVQEAAWTLQRHYPIFKEILGFEFDPLQVVLEYENPNSVFWDRVFSSHLLQGILYGFGERNAYFFDRQRNLEDEMDVESLTTHPLFASRGIRRDRKGGSVEDIPLPAFRSYSNNSKEDPIYLKFNEEREFVQKKLKGQNLVDAILSQMGYQEENPNIEIAFPTSQEATIR
ncbi:MAG: hypothetical protein P0S96_06730 [Simkaniaceae bacterium]|nr:hypothetical protein [Candidatus Sacchlamyda saccharinae]